MPGIRDLTFQELVDIDPDEFAALADAELTSIEGDTTALKQQLTEIQTQITAIEEHVSSEVDAISAVVQKKNQIEAMK